ncbi:MAG: D-lyxose/D-mannose family sugar isomerase [Bacteroidetes bacterium]|nr:D-lyxose/D-mannose family sugar isomerase [Bacteroidota bacterium]
MDKAIVKKVKSQALDLVEQAGIVLTDDEREGLEIADLGLNDIERIGLEVIEYVNNDRYCAKEIILLPWQICPEHRHPKISDKNIGKKETFRCRWGVVYLYVSGDAALNPKAKVPEVYREHLHVWHEIILHPGEQYTIQPNGLHWFQAGDGGAGISEFSSTSSDDNDVFSDPNVNRT